MQALQNVSLELKSGELLSVLGPSGCGKTTLLNIIAGFLAPTEGQVVFNGDIITGPSPERGMVFQQGALFEWMSVRSNVSFGPKMKGMPRGEMREKVDYLLDIVGLRNFKEKMVYELSGGMQQRVALARCLANEPDVILMDEPPWRAGCVDPRKDAVAYPELVGRDGQDHYPDYPFGGRGPFAGGNAFWSWPHGLGVSTKNTTCPLPMRAWAQTCGILKKTLNMQKRERKS